MRKWITKIKAYATANIGRASLNVIKITLMVLWVYTAAGKFGNMEYNKDAMHKQFFPPYMANVLAYLIPTLAVVIALFILTKFRIGLILSIGLLSAIIIFIIVVLSEIIAKETCSCAGIFQHMDYKGHLIFSIIMCIVAIIGLYIYNINKAGKPKTAARVGKKQLYHRYDEN